MNKIIYPKIPREKDARVKLSPEDRENIKRLYVYGESIRSIARLYEDKVCRRTIQFVLFPERQKIVNERSNKNRSVTKKEHNEYMKKYRRRKYLINKDEYRLWRKLTRRRR